MPIMSKVLIGREFKPSAKSFGKSAKAGLLSFLGGLSTPKKRMKRGAFRPKHGPMSAAKDPRREGQWRRVGKRWVRQRFGHEARQKRYNENYQKAFQESVKKRQFEADMESRADKRLKEKPITPPDLSHGGRIAKKKKRRRPSSQGNRLRSLLGGVSSYA